MQQYWSAADRRCIVPRATDRRPGKAIDHRRLEDEISLGSSAPRSCQSIIYKNGRFYSPPPLVFRSVSSVVLSSFE
jgi:hypothetical protein